MTIIDLLKMFPDEPTARQWFEGVRWPGGRRFCPLCGSKRTTQVLNEKPLPYRCRDCRQFFSIRTGTPMHRSKVPLQKWAVAIFLMSTAVKGISSIRLHRYIGVTQRTAWFMLHRIREGWLQGDDLMSGPVEVDESYFGGKERNKHKDKKLKKGRGFIGKSMVVGMIDRATNQARARVVKDGMDWGSWQSKPILQGFIRDNVVRGATVYTDSNPCYNDMPDYHHTPVHHSSKRYVRGDKNEIHTNSVESFWAVLKRGYKGVYHQMSFKHLHRYTNEFAGRHNARGLKTIDQMAAIVRGYEDRRLTWDQLTKAPSKTSGTQLLFPFFADRQ